MNHAYKKSRSIERLFGLGGEGGIRTLGRVAPTLDFESSTFDHSATSPDSVSFVEAAILSGATCASATQGLHHNACARRSTA